MEIGQLSKTVSRYPESDAQLAADDHENVRKPISVDTINKLSNTTVNRKSKSPRKQTREQRNYTASEQLKVSESSNKRLKHDMEHLEKGTNKSSHSPKNEKAMDSKKRCRNSTQKEDRLASTADAKDSIVLNAPLIEDDDIPLISFVESKISILVPESPRLKKRQNSNKSNGEGNQISISPNVRKSKRLSTQEKDEIVQGKATDMENQGLTTLVSDNSESRLDSSTTNFSKKPKQIENLKMSNVVSSQPEVSSKCSSLDSSLTFTDDTTKVKKTFKTGATEPLDSNSKNHWTVVKGTSLDNGSSVAKSEYDAKVNVDTDAKVESFSGRGKLVTDAKGQENTKSDHVNVSHVDNKTQVPFVTSFIGESQHHLPVGLMSEPCIHNDIETSSQDSDTSVLDDAKDVVISNAEVTVGGSVLTEEKVVSRDGKINNGEIKPDNRLTSEIRKSESDNDQAIFLPETSVSRKKSLHIRKTVTSPCKDPTESKLNNYNDQVKEGSDKRTVSQQRPLGSFGTAGKPESVTKDVPCSPSVRGRGIVRPRPLKSRRASLSELMEKQKLIEPTLIHSDVKSETEKKPEVQASEQLLNENSLAESDNRMGSEFSEAWSAQAQVRQSSVSDKVISVANKATAEGGRPLSVTNKARSMSDSAVSGASKFRNAVGLGPSSPLPSSKLPLSNRIKIIKIGTAKAGKSEVKGAAAHNSIFGIDRSVIINTLSEVLGISREQAESAIISAQERSAQGGGESGSVTSSDGKKKKIELRVAKSPELLSLFKKTQTTQPLPVSLSSSSTVDVTKKSEGEATVSTMEVQSTKQGQQGQQQQLAVATIVDKSPELKLFCTSRIPEVKVSIPENKVSKANLSCIGDTEDPEWTKSDLLPLSSLTPQIPKTLCRGLTKDEIEDILDKVEKAAAAAKSAKEEAASKNKKKRPKKLLTVAQVLQIKRSHGESLVLDEHVKKQIERMEKEAKRKGVDIDAILKDAEKSKARKRSQKSGTESSDIGKLKL